MAEPAAKPAGHMAVVEAQRAVFLAAPLTEVARRTRWAFGLGRRRREAFLFCLAAPRAVRTIGLTTLTEPPTFDALAVHGLALSAVSMSARSAVIASLSGGYGCAAFHRAVK